MFGMPDPKDTTIEVLQAEVEWLRQRNAELERQIVGFLDARVLAMTTLVKPKPEPNVVMPVCPACGESPCKLKYTNCIGANTQASVTSGNPFTNMRLATFPNPNLRQAEQTPAELEASFKMPGPR